MKMWFYQIIFYHCEKGGSALFLPSCQPLSYSPDPGIHRHLLVHSSSLHYFKAWDREVASKKPEERERNRGSPISGMKYVNSA